MRRETKKTIIGIVIILIIAATASYFLGLFPTHLTATSDGSRIALTQTPTPTPVPKSKTAPTLTPTPTPTLPPSAPPPTTTPTRSEVKFEFAISDISGSGLSWTISAQITNTGNSDAHHVWAKVEVFSSSSRVKLNGQDYLREDIGTLKATSTLTRQVRLNIGPFDGLKILSDGARFVLTLYSDEHIETFSYDYQP